MVPVVGVFATSKQAEETSARLSGKAVGQITLLTPDNWQDKVHNVCTDDMEQPGMGAVLCGLVGGGLGIAAGFELGVVAAQVLRASADPAFTLELLGAAILGVASAAAGMAAGHALEASFCDGLPKDDLYRYTGALRKGRSVVIVFTKNAPDAAAVRDVMVHVGAESLEDARRWRTAPAEEKHLTADAPMTGVYYNLCLAFKRTFHVRHH
jgi:hypothetical protein